MNRTRLLAGAVFLLAAALLGCSSSEPSKEPPDTRPAGVLPELEIVPTPAGGVALYTPVLEIEPGTDVTYCTFTDFVTDEDVFIRTTRGSQSEWGHHAIMMQTTEVREPGTVLCSGEEMETLRQLMGGTGGEGQAGYDPPERVGMTIPKGSQFVIQSHWINASAEARRVQAMMVTVPGSQAADRIDTGTVALLDVGFSVPARGASSAKVTCEFQQEQRFFMAIGHEHEWGTHVRANVIRAGGVREALFDRPFEPHHVFDPPVSTYDLDDPLVIAAGDAIEFECEWQNDTADPLTFPREMCVFFGYSMTAGDARCLNGVWLGSGGGDGGTTLPGPPCVAEGAVGNEFGVGKHCTRGGGECAASQTASICIVDFTQGDFGNFCTRLCSTDADCGAGATCQGASENSPKACIPQCESADAGAG